MPLPLSSRYSRNITLLSTLPFGSAQDNSFRPSQSVQKERRTALAVRFELDRSVAYGRTTRLPALLGVRLGYGRHTKYAIFSVSAGLCRWGSFLVIAQSG